MSINNQVLAGAIRRELANSHRGPVKVLLHNGLKEEGQQIRVGPTHMVMPFRGYFVFADLQPGANWGHPVKYLMISENIDKIDSVDGQFPPSGVSTPSDYKLLFDGNEGAPPSS